MCKIKVCILQNGLAWGGTDSFVVNLCKRLDKNRFDVTVVNPNLKPESLVREPEVLVAGAKIVHTSSLESLKSKIKHFKMLYRLLKDGKYDVFQTNIDLFNGPNLFVAWLAGVPIRCCHSHNTMQQKSVVQGMTFSVRIYQTIMKWMCWTFSNRRCGCSEIANDFLYMGKNWKSASYPTIINNGIDLDTYRQSINFEEKKRKLGLTNKINILTVGRIIPQKNPLFIAETIAILCKERPDVDFVWVSDGPQKSECVEVFRKYGVLNRIHFLGFRTDVAEIMQCCDLFYMPSCFEGLPFVLVEAQASGLNCLVSDVVTKYANCGGILYKSLNDDKESWISTLSLMVDKSIVLSIDEKKMQEFSIRHMAEQMMQIFDTH